MKRTLFIGCLLLIFVGTGIAQQTGTITGDKVRVRTKPTTTNSETVGHVNKGDKVTILDKTSKKDKIGSMENYWYKIKFDGTKKGWAFGHFIKTASDKVNNKIRDDFSGYLYNPPSHVYVGNYKWSPDGKYLLYEAEWSTTYEKPPLYKPKRVLTLKNLETREIKKLTENDNFKQFNFSEDSKIISYYSKLQEELYIYDIDKDKIVKKISIDINKDKSKGIIRTGQWLDEKLLILKNVKKKYSTGKLQLSPNEKYALFGNILYSIENEKPIIYIENNKSFQWSFNSKRLYYIQKLTDSIEIRSFNIDNLQDELIGTVPIKNEKEHPKWGMVFTCLPKADKLLIGIHYSFFYEDYDGFGYTNNDIGEYYTFFLYDINNKQIEPFYEFHEKRSVGPPIPNIEMRKNPKVNKVLVNIFNNGSYVFDIDNNTVEKVRAKIINAEERLLQSRKIYGGLARFHKQPYINLSGSLPQWSSDGKKIGSMFLGFVVIDCE